LFARETRDSITGTSINTPTTVANDAPESKPKMEIATATANSKKLLAPIIAEGAQMLCFRFKILPVNQLKKNMK